MIGCVFGRSRRVRISTKGDNPSSRYRCSDSDGGDIELEGRGRNLAESRLYGQASVSMGERGLGAALDDDSAGPLWGTNAPSR